MKRHHPGICFRESLAGGGSGALGRLVSAVTGAIRVSTDQRHQSCRTVLTTRCAFTCSFLTTKPFTPMARGGNSSL